MAQLHCYLPDEIASRLQEKARMSHMSVSKYLAFLVRKELDNQWPEEFFELCGAWRGQALTRPEHGVYEDRGEMN